MNRKAIGLLAVGVILLLIAVGLTWFGLRTNNNPSPIPALSSLALSIVLFILALYLIATAAQSSECPKYFPTSEAWNIRAGNWNGRNDVFGGRIFSDPTSAAKQRGKSTAERLFALFGDGNNVGWSRSPKLSTSPIESSSTFLGHRVGIRSAYYFKHLFAHPVDPPQSCNPVKRKLCGVIE